MNTLSSDSSTCAAYTAADYEPLLCISQVDAAELFKNRNDGVVIIDEAVRADAYTELSGLPLSVIPRGQAELSEEVAQLVTYDMLVYRDTVLVYCRGNATEARLADKLSIGVGGHVSALDLEGTLAEPAFDQSIIQARRRELQEELGVTSESISLGGEGRSSMWPILIYDQSNSVGRVHVGIVHVIGLTKLEKEKLDAGGTNLAGAEFVPISDLGPGGELHSKLESWSKLLLLSYSPSRFVPKCAQLEWETADRLEAEAERNPVSNAKPCAEMLFEANKSPDPFRYNPHRDVAYCHGPKVLAMVKLLEADACSDIFPLRLSQSDLAEAISVYLQFLENVRRYEEHKTANSALQAAGWFALRPAQRLAITSTLGSLYTVMAFQAQREVDSEASQEPKALNGSELSKLCVESCQRMTQGKWARLWQLFKFCFFGVEL